MHSLVRWKVSKLCTSSGNLLEHHDAFRQKVPDFTLEIQAYKWPALNFWRNLTIFRRKKNTGAHPISNKCFFSFSSLLRFSISCVHPNKDFTLTSNTNSGSSKCGQKLDRTMTKSFQNISKCDKLFLKKRYLATKKFSKSLLQWEKKASYITKMRVKKNSG
jgi:hypothetical protein